MKEIWLYTDYRCNDFRDSATEMSDQEEEPEIPRNVEEESSSSECGAESTTDESLDLVECKSEGN
jgi:hypothetical protein